MAAFPVIFLVMSSQWSGRIVLARGEVTDIGKTPGNGGGSSHCRADQMRSGSGALAADEITVASGSAAFPRRNLVGVHRQAGGTARLAPFETCIGKDPVKPFIFGLAFDQSGTCLLYTSDAADDREV